MATQYAVHRRHVREPHHILILVENLSVPFDRRVWHECTTLIEAGYEVSVICPRGKRHDREPYAEQAGVRIYRYPSPPSASSLAGYLREYPYMLAWTQRLAWRIWRERGFDAIHACNPPDLFFLIGWFFRSHGVSFVYDQHDANPEILIAKRGGEKRRGVPERVVRWAERRTFALADVVIAPNDSYRKLALTRGGKSTEDVFVVRSAPRWEEFLTVERDHFDRRGHRFLVGYLGVMGKQDGVDVLVRAVHLLVDAGHDIMLYLAGDGESFGEIESLVSSLGLRDNVVMAGFQTKEEFTAALRDADVCVAPDPPSPFNDISTMNKIVEYMALGSACVAFGLPENRITGGDAAVYADEPTVESLARAIGRLLDDEDERARLRDQARERFARVLAWEHSAPELRRAYERLREKVAGQRGRSAVGR
jgi:glycosyltransferase involved in cell wall biosynthesis